MDNKYIIQISKEDYKQMCNFKFEWTDEDDVNHVVATDDLGTAKNIIDLLTGETCLGDLEP